MAFAKIVAKGNFIAGRFIDVPSNKGKINCVSPANLNDQIGEFNFYLDSVADAAAVAKNAFESWAAGAPDIRLSFIKRLGQCLRDEQENFARLIAREVGKPLWECREELKTAILRCESDPSYMGWYWRKEDIATTQGEWSVDFRPRGVVAVLSPFNLPIDTTLSYALPALFLGNTVVCKPSKQTPATAQLLAECFARAEFPAGVFNLIQGDKELARRLASSPLVDVVLFTGPYEQGEQIKRDSVDPVDKTLVMEMGGKNASIVTEDADLDLARKMIMVGAYQTGGQRSTSTSRILVHRSIAPQFIESLHAAAKSLCVGNPFDEAKIPFMGPLIHPVSIERYLKFQGMAVREGAECVMRGKALEIKTPGYYVSPSIYLVKDQDLTKIRKSVFQQTELFGPCLSVYLYTELEEALALAQSTDYSLCASIFSESRSSHDFFWKRMRFGNLHWNLPTTHQDIRLPFGSVEKSGNGLYTGHQLAAALVRPVGSTILDPQAQKNYRGLPGLV